MTERKICGGCGAALLPGATACTSCGTVQAGVPSVSSGHLPATPMPHAPTAPTSGTASTQRPGQFPSPSLIPPPGPGARADSTPYGHSSTGVGPSSGPIPAATTGEPRRSGGTGKVLAIVATLVVLLAGAIGGVLVLTSHHGTSGDTATIDHSVDRSDSGTRGRPEGASGDGAATEVGSGGGNTSDTTSSAPVISAPRNTAATSKVGTPVLLPDVTDPKSAAPVVQRLATALAHHDWNAARATMPTLDQTDAQLESGYAALRESTVIVTSIFDDAYEVSGAYLAWEQLSDGARQTSVYCSTWSVDGSNGTVASAQSTGISSQAMWSGWKSPGEVADQVGHLCS